MADKYGLAKLVVIWITFSIADASSLDIFRQVNNRYGRYKREVACARRYETVTTGHTRCLKSSPQAKSLGDVTQEDQRLIVDMHNRVRGEVRPTAANMVKMSWDTSLAITASKWAFNCVQNHDKGYKRYEYGRFSVGQNLAWASYEMGWQKAISLWADEVKDFTYRGQNNLFAVGHYTQMIWATSVKVGCGQALCGGTYYYVCNYGPAGNLDINIPYKSGPTCGDCPGKCRNNFCDCGDMVCLNGAELELSTCSCKCTQRFHIPPYCGLNCTDIEYTQPRYCSQFGVSGCSIYSNVPQECPSMCRWCPYADYNIIKQELGGEPSSAIRTHIVTWTFYILFSIFMALAY